MDDFLCPAGEMQITARERDKKQADTGHYMTWGGGIFVLARRMEGSGEEIRRAQKQ